MATEKEKLRSDIEKLEDEIVIEKLRIFLAGMLAQQGLNAEKKDAGANEKESA